ncbi:LOW QUALITY PROTEIN: divergent paired-related homeobox [Oryx dammah]|uniref:LOW QUALITY PROTEIN: divergent paired-related homeobox n=1 Tax=Oryx dammah TaxID=59534 RepID=UPI001A9B0A3B|nr:LOW QUALITY PROTEIN: divergent paired-related homeobox [Oryx dammah]
MSMQTTLQKAFTGKYRKHSKRKRTIFTEKQLAYLNFLKNKNPYPTLGLQREMASKMELHLTVLQQEVLQRFTEVMVKIGSAKENVAAPPRSALEPPMNPFQLSIQPALKALTDHSLGHKMVHFGSCQDPNIYCLYPIVES